MILILFLIMDPIGNVVPFLTVLEGTKNKKFKLIVLREMAFALLLLLSFYFVGDYLMEFLGISQVTVSLTVGLILFLFALKIIYPSADHIRAKLHPYDNPLVVPLAIPLIASPSLLASIMLFGHLEAHEVTVLPAILGAWVLSLVVLFFSRKIYQVMGKNGLYACERLMGMILILIAIQRFLEGIKLFIEQ